MNLDTIGEKIDDIEVSISHRIIELFSAGLYSSPNKAFEELVCNSYDAFASKVAVYVPSDSTVEGAYIWVCDNGEGLNPKELKICGELESPQNDKGMLEIRRDYKWTIWNRQISNVYSCKKINLYIQKRWSLHSCNHGL